MATIRLMFAASPGSWGWPRIASRTAFARGLNLGVAVIALLSPRGESFGPSRAIRTGINRGVGAWPGRKSVPFEILTGVHLRAQNLAQPHLRHRKNTNQRRREIHM